MALTAVQNSGAGTKNGLADRRALHRKYEPNQKSRYATMLINLLTFHFGGDFMARLDEFEKANGEYENQSFDVFAEYVQIGTVIAHCPGDEMCKHLVFYSASLEKWNDFKAKVQSLYRSFAFYAGSNLMDQGSVEKSKAKCWSCQQYGHVASQYPNEVDKGKGSSSGNGASEGKHGKLRSTPQVARSERAT